MFKSKYFSMENAIDEIYGESMVDTSMRTNTPYFEPGNPETTKNKNIKIPPNIRDTPYKSTIEKPKKKGKKPSFYEEDAEEMPMETIKNKIIGLFNDFTNSANGILFDDILVDFKSKYHFKNSSRYISRALQELFNKGVLTFDDRTKKIYLADNNEDEEELDTLEVSDNNLREEIVDFFDTSASGSVSGISLRDINKEFKDKYSKKEIIDALKALIADKTLIKGPAEGTLIINSVEDAPEEEEEGSLIPSSGLATGDPNSDEGIDNTVTNVETPETLKQKGWKPFQTNTCVFISPDGKQKYILDKNKMNESFEVNNFMSKLNEYNYDALVFEAAQIIDDMEVEDDNLDNTAGLDEFDSTEDDLDDETADLDAENNSIDIELTRDELETIAPILKKLLAIVDTDDAEDIEDSDLEDDEPVDDLATDEETTEDLFADEDEEDECCEGKKCKKDLEDEEDEEVPADETVGGVYDGSATLSRPQMARKHTVKYDRSGNPINAKGLTPRPGQADDCAASVSGGPKMTKTTPPFDKNGNPVKSKVTAGASSNKSYWDL